MTEGSLERVLPGDPRWRQLPLYRWWRTSVVDSVDYEEVIARIVKESGWSPPSRCCCP